MTHEERVYHHLYETMEGIAEQSERIASLEELVVYAYECAVHSDHATCSDCRRMNGKCLLADRMSKLGVEVE